ncbi:MAG: hypothetical protein Q6363_007750 [Candidatus Njordarchaeota archaeon]
MHKRKKVITIWRRPDGSYIAGRANISDASKWIHNPIQEFDVELTIDSEQIQRTEEWELVGVILDQEIDPGKLAMAVDRWQKHFISIKQMEAE